MAEPSAQLEEVGRLTGLLLEGALQPEDRRRLEAMLLADPAALEYYQDYVDVHCLLHWQHGAGESSAPGDQGPQAATDELAIISDELSMVAPAAGGHHLPFFARHSELGGWLFSYAAATVLTALAILGAWAYKVSLEAGRGFPTAHVAVGDDVPLPPTKPAPELVGRITGLADCRWANPQETPPAAVALGRKYQLVSGLVEISYDSGAIVILQGPCAYEVDSAAGGFLALGRLTARVETKGEGGRRKAEETESPKSEIRNPKSPFPLPPSPFVVRTPTATVTDLGTEFGVDVDKTGATQSHVFRGKVEMRVAEDGNRDVKVIPLGENESARVEINGGRTVPVISVVGGAKARPVSFMRQMPRWVQIEAFSTGATLKEGEPDPHWQLAARSDDPHFQPRPALVTRVLPNYYLANDPARSQWISQVGDLSALPEQVTYTFRTTFDLAGALPEKALLCGKFLADDHVDAVRLNGRKVDVPDHGYEWPFVDWHEFKAAGGFVAGKNVLEIDVFNGNPDIVKAATQMALRVELEVLAVSDPAAPPALQIANAAVAASGLAGDDGRRMPLPAKVGVLDLLDIVAGGDGAGRLREQGIDPTTGERDAAFPPFDRHGDRHYHPLPWNRLVDGVFVPDGTAGPVQLDSAGHTFRLPATNGDTHGSIWARAADLGPERLAMSPAYSAYAMGRGDEYMPDNRGLLAVHANAAITFDLKKICQAHSDVVRPVLFRAFAGRAHPRGVAEIWVFVDGRLKYQRPQLRQQDSPVRVDVELGPADRFLTLVSTDADRNTGNDWVVFGDPVLHVELKKESNK